MNRILFVAADESNHCSSPQEGEFVVAVFSYNERDANPQQIKCRKKRDYETARSWMANSGNDYRFTILPQCADSHCMSNLVYAVPSLVRNYLETSQEAVRRRLRDIEVHLDGRLAKSEKEYLAHELECLARIKIDSYPKRGRNPYILRCPPMVAMADVWANIIYRTHKNSVDPETLSALEVVQDSHFVRISPQTPSP